MSALSYLVVVRCGVLSAKKALSGDELKIVGTDADTTESHLRDCVKIMRMVIDEKLATAQATASEVASVAAQVVKNIEAAADAVKGSVGPQRADKPLDDAARLLTSLISGDSKELEAAK